jgi:hypothetical protein
LRLCLASPSGSARLSSTPRPHFPRVAKRFRRLAQERASAAWPEVMRLACAAGRPDGKARSVCVISTCRGQEPEAMEVGEAACSPASAPWSGLGSRGCVHRTEPRCGDRCGPAGMRGSRPVHVRPLRHRRLAVAPVPPPPPTVLVRRPSADGVVAQWQWRARPPSDARTRAGREWDL